MEAARQFTTAEGLEGQLMVVKITLADGSVQTITVPGHWEDFVALLKARPEVLDAVAL